MSPRLTRQDPDGGLAPVIASQSNRPENQDLEFLDRPELRPVRLLLDYWKPELGLARERAFS